MGKQFCQVKVQNQKYNKVVLTKYSVITVSSAYELTRFTDQLLSA